MKTSSKQKEARPPRDTGKRYGVNAKMFVKIWAESSSLEEVKLKTGLPTATIHTRCSLYRKRGITLKKMPRSTTNKLDVAALNKVIQESEKES